MADKKCGYAGSIKNTSSQVVRAPFTQESKKGKSTVKTGKDLRNGNK